MLRDVPLPPSPDSSPDHDIITNSLNDAFDAMLLGPLVVSPDNFSDEWGTADTEEALALSGVDDARLKDCIVSATASVWDVPTMHLAQLKACYHLLHPHQPNALVVVHWTGGGGRCTYFALSYLLQRCNCTRLQYAFWVTMNICWQGNTITKEEFHHFP